MSDEFPSSQPDEVAFAKRRARFLGWDADQLIKRAFGTVALAAIVILGLITIFLFREGLFRKSEEGIVSLGFLEAYHNSLELYRRSGLEYVDVLKREREDYTELTRYLNGIRGEWIKRLKEEGLTQQEIGKRIADPKAQAFFTSYLRAGSALRRYVQEQMESAIELRDAYLTHEHLRDAVGFLDWKVEELEGQSALSQSERQDLVARLEKEAFKSNLSKEEVAWYRELARQVSQGEGRFDEEVARAQYMALLKAEKTDIETKIRPVDFKKEVQAITGSRDEWNAINKELVEKIHVCLREPYDFKDPELNRRIARFGELNRMFINGALPRYGEQIKAWDQDKPVPPFKALMAFLTGMEWTTASDQQDWYGLMPLFTGSLLIAVIALFFAVPFGVGAAIYANQIASRKECDLIKPYIEFIQALPSVVIGFFGVMVFGQFVRDVSQWEMLSWVPFFPIQERLNAFTAGCLLALMAIPTIFTLSEDALNNVPRHFKEASFAMGSTRLQTTMRIMVPTALSGIISAVMLGFGRVMGETMVVLLCAGNRIMVPDLSDGLGMIFEPVHTMTGIIAQEMGEVQKNSLHYRALFMVGIVLFFLSLFINYAAQWVVRRFRKVGD